eukprot:TRINITY_DN3256_c0_g1_i2.p1 TRINITY_DN3256_c0_g1~~TRINITY_DN3256_c0_g1_i2.p1  ORF type:complete len:243 (-),score=46.64 TRINITY_DN3256_c0_g1_i2:319-1047(-)
MFPQEVMFSLADDESAQMKRHQLESHFEERDQTLSQQHREIVANKLQYYQTFNQQVDDMNEELESLKENYNADSLALINDKVVELRSEVAAQSTLLSKSDTSNLYKEIDKLTACIHGLSTEVITKKKFSFRSKKSRKTTRSEMVQDITPKGIPQTRNSNVSNTPAPTLTNLINEEHRILENHPEDTVILTNLNDCIIYITKPLNALHCRNLVGCRVYSSIISGSVYIEDSNNSQFHVACKQV